MMPVKTVDHPECLLPSFKAFMKVIQFFTARDLNKVVQCH